jgi:hypothetical protein
MTEAEWFGCDDPEPMLDQLPDGISPRKLRLFACACCLRALQVVPSTTCVAGVLVAEDYADGLADGQQLRTIEAELRADYEGTRGVGYCCEFACRVGDSAIRIASGASVYAADALSAASNEEHTLRVHLRRTPTWGAARAEQALLLSDLFGPLPFRSVKVDAGWLAWNGSAVKALARGIYDDRAFDRLPVLADALEEAGCTDADILGHCRGPGPHVRGCWVVDLLLGKE